MLQFFIRIPLSKEKQTKINFPFQQKNKILRYGGRITVKLFCKEMNHLFNFIEHI